MNYTTEEIAQMIVELVEHAKKHENMTGDNLFSEASQIAEKSREEEHEEFLTEAEQKEFIQLLEKFANTPDMAIMNATNQAQELLNTLNEL